MKVICTTSDKYAHLIPVFTYLFQKAWPNQPVEVVGYQRPACELPEGWTFYSHGVQGPVSEWSTNLRQYFEKQNFPLAWVMEDCFIRSADLKGVALAYDFISHNSVFGRFDLTKDVQNRPHTKSNNGVVFVHPDTNYRFSTQPSIWQKEFLMQYLTPGLTPWQAEKQECKNDGWHIVGFEHPPLRVNEGVRRFDIHKLDLNGFDQVDIDHINTLL